MVLIGTDHDIWNKEMIENKMSDTDKYTLCTLVQISTVETNVQQPQN